MKIIHMRVFWKLYKKCLAQTAARAFEIKENEFEEEAREFISSKKRSNRER